MMDIHEYQQTDGLRRWELLYEGIFLVLLSEEAPTPYASELLAFSTDDLNLAWRLSPQLGHEKDHIANVWVKESALWAGSYSGFAHRINHLSGEVIETKFTK